MIFLMYVNDNILQRNNIIIEPFEFNCEQRCGYLETVSIIENGNSIYYHDNPFAWDDVITFQD